jgi:hypothetical protein
MGFMITPPRQLLPTLGNAAANHHWPTPVSLVVVSTESNMRRNGHVDVITARLGKVESRAQQLRSHTLDRDKPNGTKLGLDLKKPSLA